MKVKSIEFLNYKNINKYIHSFGRESAYDTPLFKILFWRRLKYFIKVILKLQNLCKTEFRKVLDIGFNLGHFSLNYGTINPKAELYGLDIKYKEKYERRFIIQLFKKFSINFNIVIQDIQEKSFFQDEFFDLIVAFDVLEHVKSPKLALDEIKRILKNDGILLISVPIESKLLRFFKIFYKKTVKQDLNLENHWQGEIPSFKEFDKLVKKEFRLIYNQYYPFKNFPSIFSYDILYILSKNQ
ncbi:MAG: class I SAM-dependent methyltransferase [Promethearchaeota archaeon]|nr:MAG: class I SAM-dependent methyltransferase [Candidatus Lokiarchaeota archaeon]